MREHWRELDYWRWLWHGRLSSQIKIVLGAFVLAILLGGGWFAADRLTAANAGVSGTDSYFLETTVQQFVTVREKGKVVRKLVPVVKRVRVLVPRTAFQTKTDVRYRTDVVTTPGKVLTVRRLVKSVVPVVKRQVVTVNGKTHTVVTTRLVPTTRTQTLTQTQTQTRVVTNQQTVTDSQTVTQTEKGKDNTKTVTNPPVTVTQTKTDTVSSPPVTVTQTQTVTNTVTGPTQTVTVTETVTQTVTDTKTVTETVPGP